MATKKKVDDQKKESPTKKPETKTILPKAAIPVASAPQTHEEIRQQKQAESELAKRVSCIRCTSTNAENFYISNDRYHIGYGKVPYCKTCIGEIYLDYLKNNNNNEQIAMFYTCRKLDIPYNNECYDSAVTTIENPNSTFRGETGLIKAYIKNLNSLNTHPYGLCFDDSRGAQLIKGMIEYTDIVNIKSENKYSGGDDIEYIEYSIIDLKHKWGNLSNVSLEWLETQYLRWVDSQKGQVNLGMEIIIQQVCFLEMEIYNDRQVTSSSSKSTMDKIKMLRDLMDKNGLIEKRDADRDSIKIGTSIRDIETNRPIKGKDESFADVDGILRMIHIIVGALSRVFGRKNFYTDEFDKHYGQYTYKAEDYISKENTDFDVQDSNKNDMSGGEADG